MIKTGRSKSQSNIKHNVENPNKINKQVTRTKSLVCKSSNTSSIPPKQDGKNNKKAPDTNNNTNTTSHITSIDTFIQYLLSFNKQENAVRKKLNNSDLADFSFRINLPIKLLNIICLKTFSLFEKEANILQLSAPFYIFGDIHGQFSDLIRFIEMVGMPPNVKLLFLGDYVDRGNNSLEVIAFLFCLKIKYPKHVFLIRGNHECSQVNDNYGFLEECVSRYGNVDGNQIWHNVNQTFRMLPLCALINKKIFCTHGGISPNIKSFAELNCLNRNTDIPNSGIMCDLTWSDPKTQQSKWKESDRGVSYTFNKDALSDFKKRLNIDLVIRAHQVVDDGYQFFDNKSLVTVFSAPNYCGHNDNNGAVLKIKKNLDCSFIILKPTNKKIKKQKTLSISKQ
jgi:serine/threonine-protein phosphatase PP1 catalytic subunit